MEQESKEMEITPIYKVGDVEFSDKNKAQEYLNEMKLEMEKKEDLEKIKAVDFSEITNAEKNLWDLYSYYEKKYGYLPNRSNNIKELLRSYI